MHNSLSYEPVRSDPLAAVFSFSIVRCGAVRCAICRTTLPIYIMDAMMQNSPQSQGASERSLVITERDEEEFCIQSGLMGLKALLVISTVCGFTGM